MLLCLVEKINNDIDSFDTTDYRYLQQLNARELIFK